MLEKAINKNISNRSRAIDLAKCLAVLLILNNHMKIIYPNASFAFGGSLGNALFFFVSGYTWSNLHNRKFFSWYAAKLERIWIPTVFTNIAYIFLFSVDIDIIELFKIFIYPNKSWFCGAILVYAIAYYFAAKKYDRSILFFIAILAVTYGTWYLFVLNRSRFSLEGFVNGGLCRFSHYALCMLMGLVYKKNEDRINIKTGKFLLPVGIILFFVSYGSKIIIKKSLFLLQFQFVIQILTLACAFCIFAGLRNYEPRLNKIKHSHFIVEKIASYSWECYLVQTQIIPLCARIRFPFNLLTALFMICIFTWLLKKLCNIVFRLINKVFGS